MIKNERAKQGGSAIIFVVVGIILVISLAGTLYLLKNRGEQFRKEQAIEAYENDEKEVASENKEEIVTDENNVEEEKIEVVQPIPSAVTDLPVTGSASVLYKGFIISLIGVVSVYYFISRKYIKVRL